MPSDGMLRRVALVRIGDSEECIASTIRVKRIIIHLSLVMETILFSETSIFT
jgi:hypothetical protein